MSTFFSVAFGVGVGYAIISFFLGEVIGFLEFDGDADIGGDAVSPLKPAVISSFLVVFGGCGMLLRSRLGLLMTLSMAIGIASVIAFVIYRFIIVPLHNAQSAPVAEHQSLIGLDAKVTLKIPQGRFGKIIYHYNDNTYSAPARSEDGFEIARNELVEIVSIEKNVFFVSKLN